MKKTAILIVATVAILLLAAFAGLWFYLNSVSQKNLEIKLGELEKQINDYLSTPIKISLDNNLKEIKPTELGLTVSASKNLNISVKIDRYQLEEALDNNFKITDSGPVSASFFFNDKGKLEIKEGKDGVVIDEAEFIKNLKESARKLNSDDQIKIASSKKTPEVSLSMLEKEQAKTEEMLNHQFTLLDPIYSDDWDLKLKDHLDWVSFVQGRELNIPVINKKVITREPVDGLESKAVISIEINQKNLNAFVDEKISKWLDRPVEDVNIYTDKDGKVVIEGKGGDGKKIQREKLKKAIELAVAEKIKDVPIPVAIIQPKVTISEDLKEKGIKERIAVGHTSYYGSPANRIHNIKTGAAKYNGLIVAPDEVFSFNKNLGRVDASTGFKKELVIKSEGTLPEFGGGICQVSTTMFRTALLGGLSLVERNQHSYAVSYYSQILGHGLDATIYLGGPDFRFKNDTGQHILIETYTENDYELYIIFYGTADGRRVEMEGPYLSNYHNPGPTIYVETTDLAPGQTKQVEKAHTGFNALWYRHLFDANGKETVEPIKTEYKAVANKILKGVEKTE